MENASQREELVQRAVTALQSGQLGQLERAALALLERDPRDAGGLMFLGIALLHAGRAEQSLEHLDMSARQSPDNGLVHMCRGRTLVALKRFESAREAFERALECDPKLAEARLLLGKTLETLELFEEACAAYEGVDAGSLEEPFALASLSGLRLHLGDYDGARVAAVAAVDIDEKNSQALVAWARVMLATDAADSARARLTRELGATKFSSNDRIMLLSVLAEAHQSVGDYDASFAATTQSNLAMRATLSSSGQNIDPLAVVEHVRSMSASVAATPAEIWPELDKDEVADPVFLVGFPRSGTTLLDQVLSSHSHGYVVEEREADFSEMWKAMSGPSEGVGDLLAKLDADDVGVVRDDYRKRLSRDPKFDRDRLVIQKMPLLLAWLPALRRFWPNARYILAVRDPRDCVLSAVQSSFSDNIGMRAMLTIESAAAYYDVLMAQFHEFTSRVPCRVHVVRYEDVVDDFDGTILSLLGFLDLPWEDSIRDYSLTARDRKISTPSARQVVQPLYRRSVGKWRTYESHMQPVRSVLDPWAAKFGYQ